MICALLSSCNGKTDDGGVNDKDKWIMAAPLVDKVEVRCADELVESYEYTYDSLNRLSSMVHTDCISGDKFLDLQYSYPSDGQTKILGKFLPVTTNRFITANLDAKDRTISYSGSWTGGWSYITSFDGNGLVTGTVSEIKFAASKGSYNSNTLYKEDYLSKGDGCISEATYSAKLRLRRLTPHR